MKLEIFFVKFQTNNMKIKKVFFREINNKIINISRAAVLKIIKLYKLFSLFTKPTCRFFPTCSEYAQEAIKKHGLIVGAKLSILRIIKCRPYGKYGVDMVPDTIDRRKK